MRSCARAHSCVCVYVCVCVCVCVCVPMSLLERNTPPFPQRTGKAQNGKVCEAKKGKIFTFSNTQERLKFPCKYNAVRGLICGDWKINVTPGNMLEPQRGSHYVVRTMFVGVHNLVTDERWEGRSDLKIAKKVSFLSDFFFSRHSLSNQTLPPCLVLPTVCFLFMHAVAFIRQSVSSPRALSIHLSISSVACAIFSLKLSP